MEYQYQHYFERNAGLISSEEQEILRGARIAIAGLGGIGGLAAERLIRLGVGGLRITDPGDFEVSNINRQFGATTRNIGKNKTEEIVKLLKDINPLADIEYNTTGVTRNAGIVSFLNDCKVIIDAMDFGMIAESILLQREARRMGLHYLFSAAIGFGAISVVFSPGGITLEEYNKISKDINPYETQRIDVPIDCILPVTPSYVQATSLLKDVLSGKIPVPTSSIGAGLAALQATTEAMNIIIGRDVPEAPYFTYLDLVDRRLIVGKVNL